jgi:hypothetical protein
MSDGEFARLLARYKAWADRLTFEAGTMTRGEILLHIVNHATYHVFLSAYRSSGA